MRDRGRSGAVLGMLPKVETIGEFAGDAARFRKGLFEFRLVSPGEGSLPASVDRFPELAGDLRVGNAGERFRRPISRIRSVTQNKDVDV